MKDTYNEDGSFWVCANDVCPNVTFWSDVEAEIVGRTCPTCKYPLEFVDKLAADRIEGRRGGGTVYRYEITKDFPFEAGHVLRDMPEGHKCGRPHGHSYVVRITLASDTLNDVGFVQDYGDLDPIKKWIDATLDHRFLNTDVDIFKSEGGRLNPTAENIAMYIYRTFETNFPCLVSVSVSETAKTWATYRPNAPESLARAVGGR